MKKIIFAIFSLLMGLQASLFCNEEDPSMVKQVNQAFYSTRADRFEKIPFSHLLPFLFQHYSESLPGKKVLDVGSGPGALSQWIQKKGYDVFCLDPNKEMIKRCKEKGLPCINSYFEDYETDETYDHIFALSSLMHIPKKDIRPQLSKVSKMLNPGGIFYVSVILGRDDNWQDIGSTSPERYFYAYEKEDFLEMFHRDFSLIEQHEIFVPKTRKTFLLAVMRKV